MLKGLLKTSDSIVFHLLALALSLAVMARGAFPLPKNRNLYLMVG
jgi:hypothetical protein